MYSLTVGNDGSLPDAWVEEEALKLPEARAGASAVAVADGIVLMGGTNGTAPTTTVWKSKQVDRRRAGRMGAAVARCSRPTSTGSPSTSAT